MSYRSDPPRERHRLLNPAPDRAVDWELRHHIEERVDRLVAEGWDPTEARAEAERRFGDVGAYREELTGSARKTQGRRWRMELVRGVVRDVRGALRGMSRNPTFAVGFVLTLALGLGATTAIFAIVDAVMLRPLPYEDPDRLVEVWLAMGTSSLPFVPADQAEELEASLDFLAPTAFSETTGLVRTDGEPERLSLLVASHDLDDLLGVVPHLGRTFGPGDAIPGGERVLLLSHAYWTRTGADPDIVGSRIRLEGEPWTVVGVLPRGFKYPVAGRPDAWIPATDDMTAAGEPISRVLIVGRLPEGVDVDVAQQRADAATAALAEARPTSWGWQTRLRGVDAWRGNADLRRSLWMLSAAVGLMLAIALFNATNLLLLRGQERAREWAVRRSLGASAAQIVRKVVVESVVLASVAAGAAALLASASLTAVRRIMPSNLEFSSAHAFTVEGRALGFAFVAALGTGLLTGLLPAARAAIARSGAGLTTRDGGRSSGVVRAGNSLVVAEVALSMTLLVGAALFLRSFAAMLRDDPGFDVDRLAFVGLSLSERAYPTATDRKQLTERLRTRLADLPGVEAVAVSEGAPPSGGGLYGVDVLYPEGREPIEGFAIVPYLRADEAYLDVLGARMVEGRAARWDEASAGATVVDLDLARHLFGDASAVGRRFRLSEDGDPWTVVGVVEELKLGGADNALSPYAMVRPADPDGIGSTVDITLRATDPSAVLDDVRAVIREVDGGLPLSEVSVAADALAESVATPRFLVVLVASLAGLALALAALGTYGVLAYSVRQRYREMGIRIALGASTAHIRGSILGRGVALALVGVLVGAGASVALARFVESMVFGVSATDPWARASAAALMVTVAVVACWIPARRATRVDPMEVLNAE